MSNETIGFDGQAQERATALLSAAEKLGLEPGVVQTVDGGFSAPEEVVKEAGLHTVKDEDSTEEPDEAPKKRGGRRAKSTEE